MKVLVAVGSKYGSTREIAQVIGAEIQSTGFDVDVEDACDVLSVDAYDAIIVGSAVYGGLWRRDASALIRQHADALKRRDVWMFSTGIRELKEPGYATGESEQLASLVGAQEHETFPGAIDYDRLNVGERAVMHAINPPLGDHRDFSAARDWAHGIGVKLLYLALA
ncbi:flavodoxin domain-containing protein [Demequina aurantiaca]|uniref:flavodoxin domain-containing protein n=1 Tax=Demequina aurantiaca TaxID=676200 RepID=UPI000782E640|nr:flavodoxin domain-containing protein [Demequina aurantiaca]